MNPALFAIFRIQRHDAVVRGAEVEGLVDHQRRGLKGRGAVNVGAAGYIAGLVGPGHFEPVDIVAGNLFQWAEPLPPVVAADGGPFRNRP